MDVPPKDIPAQVSEWMEYAQTDLRAARLLLPDGAALTRQVGFHAQQAAEKAIKAFLTHRKIGFPFTHSINLLRELVPDDAAWIRGIEAADRLSEYATTARYPGLELEVARADAESAIQVANDVIQKVSSALRQEGWKPKSTKPEDTKQCP